MDQSDFIALFVAIPVVFLTAAFVVAVYAHAHRERWHEGELDEAMGMHGRGEWALVIGLSLVYILAGLQVTAGDAIEALVPLMSQFEAWGYSEGFRYLVGASQVVAAILLIPPQTSAWAAGFLALLMVGAVYTLVAAGSVVLALVPLTMLALLVLVVLARTTWWRQYFVRLRHA